MPAMKLLCRHVHAKRHDQLSVCLACLVHFEVSWPFASVCDGVCFLFCLSHRVPLLSVFMVLFFFFFHVYLICRHCGLF